MNPLSAVAWLSRSRSWSGSHWSCRSRRGRIDPAHHHAAAYAVVAATHPASARLKRSSAPDGEFYVWLEPQYVDRLRELRKPGESYSDVILRTAEASEGGE